MYLAWALLESANLMILAESIAALDSETARLALETTVARAKDAEFVPTQ